MITIAGIVAIIAVMNAILPAVSRSTGSIIASSSAVQDRIASQIEIVHATGQNGNADASVWAKNVGAATVAPIDHVDVFFGPAGDFARVPYGVDSNCAAPCWYETFENSSDWSPTATLRISVKAANNLTSGTTYYVKVVTPTGAIDSKYFTV
jgi:flagellar protein FlaG